VVAAPSTALAKAGPEVAPPDATTAAEPTASLFRAPDGRPSPLPDATAVGAFLRSAPIVDAKPIGKGVTKALRVVLVQGPITARAAFHDIDVKKTMGTIKGRPMPHFVDSYRSQIAAYELDRLMGLDRVPPTVARTYNRRRGSLHFWIEGGMDLEGVLEGKGPKVDRLERARQMHDVWVFDALIRNTDRNQGNLVFDGDGRLWWIDHTRAFGQGKELVGLERVKRCSRQLWDALRALEAKQVREGLSPYLSIFEIKALLKRRDALVEHLEEMIAEQGEERILFDGS
jgi:hypothetical protein